MANIATRQNEPKHIAQLQAQRMLYDQVRKIKLIRLFGATAINALWVYIAISNWQSEIMVVIGSGLLVAFEYLTEQFWQERIHKKAVLVQEVFDTEVLDLPWNEDHTLIGSKPMSDEIAQWSARYNDKRYKDAPLQNWYADKVDQIPLTYARLCCQKSNIDWDVGLRKRYIFGYVLLIVAIVAVFAILIRFWGIAEVNKYWVFFAAVLPLLKIGWEETKGSFKAIENLKRMRNRIDAKWQELLQGEASDAEIDSASRVWQDEIFRHRLHSPVLPRFIYRLKRSEDEVTMYRSSEALADEVLASDALMQR
ncbi:hypothetical protein KC734_07610 [candidate division KSB1 bacterium]|nr:hypothetical protein [candidate division KSB1 bacterium]